MRDDPNAVPLRYARGNVLFGQRDEVASLHGLPMVSYPLLPERDKELHAARLARLALSAEADFAIHRVNRLHPSDEYVEQARALRQEDADPAVWEAFCAGHQEHLQRLATFQPECYAIIQQRGMQPRGWMGHLTRASDRIIRSVNDAFDVGDPAPLPGAEIDANVQDERDVHARVRTAFPTAWRGTTRDVQWLARRAGPRHVAEPLIDPWWKPNAMVVRGEDGGVAYDTDGLFIRLFDAEIRREDDHVVVLSQAADGSQVITYQAFLLMGMQPDELIFPGPMTELMSGPLGDLDFPVDTTLRAQWIANKRAISEIRRAIKDSGIQLEDAMHGNVMLDDGQLEMQSLGRNTISYLQSSNKPPIVQASLGFHISSRSAEVTRNRVKALRECMSGVVLHHPSAWQEFLFYDSLPRAGGPIIRAYRDLMTADVLGAMMPTATRHVGHQQGVYTLYTVAPSGMPDTPVKIDLTANARRHKPTSMYVGGQMGSGKTTFVQNLAHAGALSGSEVHDLDPKPDHNLCALPSLKGISKIVSLEANERYRGELDPFTHAPEALRADVVTSYLLEVLPSNAAGMGDWESDVMEAVRDQMAAGGTGGLLGILSRLEAMGTASSREVARRLQLVSETGLGMLAFGDGTTAMQDTPRVTTYRMPGVELPDASLPREDYELSDRMAVATFKLLATRIMGRCTRDRSKPKIVILDEAWMFLKTQRGRALLNKLVRMGRSFNVTVIIVSQTIEELGALGDLIGMRAMFGVATPAEARRALSLVKCDPDDESLVELLTNQDVFKEGRCLFCDGTNTADCQVDLVYDDVREVLDTSPQAKHAVAA